MATTSRGQRRKAPYDYQAPRFVMIGGFLGSGKTTTILQLAKYVKELGYTPGIITNDQADGLVDTALVEEMGVAVQEVAGGCFCCRSEELVSALTNLRSRGGVAHSAIHGRGEASAKARGGDSDGTPNVLIAEPVGSCTDLIATVTLPLVQVYKAGFTMAPYVVLADPFRLEQTLRLGGQQAVFSPDVEYIYRKQLEEAEIIAVNKIELLTKERLRAIVEGLACEYPDTKLLQVSSRDRATLLPMF